MSRSDRSRRGRTVWAALTGAWLAASGAPLPTALAQTAAPVQILNGESLLALSPSQLDGLYRAAGPGAQPVGRVRGIPIVAPGTPMGQRLSKGARLVWQGKVFHDDGATAVNRFFGMRMIKGNLYQGQSWVDGRPSLILDYNGTSLVYGKYRDEIRQIGPGLYLGVMFARTKNGNVFDRYFAFETAP